MKITVRRPRPLSRALPHPRSHVLKPRAHQPGHRTICASEEPPKNQPVAQAGRSLGPRLTSRPTPRSVTADTYTHVMLDAENSTTRCWPPRSRRGTRAFRPAQPALAYGFACASGDSQWAAPGSTSVPSSTRPSRGRRKRHRNQEAGGVLWLACGCASRWLDCWRSRAPVSRPHLPSSTGPVVVTLSGALMEGVTTASGQEWRGIPFAAPPIGALRFRPAPAGSWSGVRDATRFGSPCLQPDEFAPDGSVASTLGSEDCLFLNVFAP